MKIKGNPIGTTMRRPDWKQTDPTKSDYIRNKPNIEAELALERARIDELVARSNALAGFIYPLATDNVPDGFLLCDGAEYKRSEYPELFAAIGTTYGEGNGETTFNVPNLSTKVPVGAGDGYALGDTGGEEKHTLTEGEMPKHIHGQTAMAEATDLSWGWTDFTTDTHGIIHHVGSRTDATDDFRLPGETLKVAHVATFTATMQTGGDQPHNNMQPYTVVNYIISTGKEIEFVVGGRGGVGGETDYTIVIHKRWNDETQDNDYAIFEFDWDKLLQAMNQHGHVVCRMVDVDILENDGLVNADTYHLVEFSEEEDYVTFATYFNGTVKRIHISRNGSMNFYTDNHTVKTVNGIAPDENGNVSVVGKFTAEGGAVFGDYETNKATAKFAFAQGSGTSATNLRAHAEGQDTVASGKSSHTEGKTTEASGEGSHAEGVSTVAAGNASHAEGRGTKTNTEANYSHAEGLGTIAAANAQHVQGKYNIEDTEKKYAHIIGNGSSSKRSNAHTLDWDGNAWFAGDVCAGDVSLKQLNDTIGDISTALDELHAYAEALKGGGAV